MFHGINAPCLQIGHLTGNNVPLLFVMDFGIGTALAPLLFRTLQKLLIPAFVLRRSRNLHQIDIVLQQEHGAFGIQLGMRILSRIQQLAFQILHVTLLLRLLFDLIQLVLRLVRIPRLFALGILDVVALGHEGVEFLEGAGLFEFFGFFVGLDHGRVLLLLRGAEDDGSGGLCGCDERGFGSDAGGCGEGGGEDGEGDGFGFASEVGEETGSAGRTVAAGVIIFSFEITIISSK
mmetsp:Transcript_29429/g.62017  ORF Transcript_29429/g.62017 Transcript_29429/m.62017 type:complete len:234 (-) Transcript_29429:262-963(-)